MRVTLIPSDGVAIIDGRAIQIDLSDMPANIHAVQWNEVSGHVEYTDKLNELLLSIAPFQTWIDRWFAAKEIEDAPPPPPPPPTLEQRRAEIDRQRDAKLAAGLKIGDNTFHTDAVFQSQLQAFLLAWETGILPADATVSVRTKENAILQMTQAEVKQLAAQIMAYVQQVYAESWVAKDALQ